MRQEVFARLFEKVVEGRPEVAERLLDDPGVWRRFTTWVRERMVSLGFSKGSAEWVTVARALDRVESAKKSATRGDDTPMMFSAGRAAESPRQRENRQRGEAAIGRVVREQADVPNAMDVPGLGSVDFLWLRQEMRPRTTQEEAASLMCQQNTATLLFVQFRVCWLLVHRFRLQTEKACTADRPVGRIQTSVTMATPLCFRYLGKVVSSDG